MSLIKLSGLNLDELKVGLKKVMPSNLALAGGLTVGLGAAEGAVGALEAKPGQRTTGALKGAGKGLVEGAVLGAVEPHVTHLLNKLKKPVVA